MLLSVIREVLECRQRAPRVLVSEWALVAKLLLLAVSLALSTTQPPHVVLVYTTTLLALLLALGLRATTLYVVVSCAALYASMATGALVFHGDLVRVTRFTLIAASTLPVLVLIASTTTPYTVRRAPLLYLLLVVFNSVLREVLDVATVYKARGVEGLEYWLRVVVASMALSTRRSTALVDSLRARGVEVE